MSGIFPHFGALYILGEILQSHCIPFHSIGFVDSKYEKIRAEISSLKERKRRRKTQNMIIYNRLVECACFNGNYSISLRYGTDKTNDLFKQTIISPFELDEHGSRHVIAIYLSFCSSYFFRVFVEFCCCCRCVVVVFFFFNRSTLLIGSLTWYE